MVTVNMVATGANIKNMMKARNIKVKDVQTVCGFGTPQAIFKWMRGDCMPTIDNMMICLTVRLMILSLWTDKMADSSKW